MDTELSDGIYIMRFDLQTKSSNLVSLDVFIEESKLIDKYIFYWIDLENIDLLELDKILQLLPVPVIYDNFFGRPEILPHIQNTIHSISFYIYDIINADSHSDSTKDIMEIEHEPLLLILSKHFVITFHQKPLDLIKLIKKDCQENFRLAGRSPAFVAFLLMQHCTYNYARINLANDNFLDEIESNVLNRKKVDFISPIAIAGYNILILKKMNEDLRIILLILATKLHPVVSAKSRNYFNHLLKDCLGIREGLDSSRNLLDSIIASIQTDASRKTSQIVQILTMVSTIFLPLTLVTGIYGMNFENMPELHWQYGYFYTLAILLSIFIGFIYFFKRKGWIWSGKEDEND